MAYDVSTSLQMNKVLALILTVQCSLHCTGLPSSSVHEGTIFVQERIPSHPAECLAYPKMILKFLKSNSKRVFIFSPQKCWGAYHRGFKNRAGHFRYFFIFHS